MVPPAAVLTDIEGTTTPIAFVHRVLFPYARARLAAFCAAHAEVGGVPVPPLETLYAQMDRDEKDPVLKTIQGMIWEEGYAAGELKAEIYADVAPALRRWARGGVRLYVYSSGSVPAQKLLFGHSAEGDLTPLFQAYFDTKAGPKREAASYGAITRGIGIPAGEVLFLSDVEAELDAARAAGLRTCQLVRPQDGTLASARHPTAVDFAGVAQQFGLPHV
ncbi:enolase-phosphatase E1 [Acidocella aquatica]|uniref:Enolase-phosphatase E1 n=1 Tax=Acidocella aquatica TaxID=1922313 RepID=A0ABQ6A6L3_9PROT|nr:acireductone synthase [Acidocella aquatica]GLR67298.1 enolase-phosphatase E1 [Acidocella aquatica]